MVFISKHANYCFVVSTTMGAKTLKFQDFALDTKRAARQTGMTEKAITEAMKASPYFGVDFDTADGK